MKTEVNVTVSKRSRSKLDWISSLPDCLLCQILSNLPTQDAVKTSTLSTRWRSLWKHCFLSSLEYVKIERPLKGEAMEMRLVSYLLENSKILKKLTLVLDVSIKTEESAVLKKLLIIPRLSTSCQVVVL
ncbi:unnamed protein product [Brassica oleracea var. botrytis]|uniref:F-box domain-containing protein n=3 Tax=Brassica TaxID=3705 RepID=A0A0D3D1N2_BRAOL|nr:unnamed protein product [Brassica napus]VDD64830.1 unnamed protein product [Brassica oleracea]